MIQAIPGKARYQIFMDHAVPGHFEFVAGLGDALKAEHHAERLHAEYQYGDVVVLDSVKDTLLMTLPGKRTLCGKTV